MFDLARVTKNGSGEMQHMEAGEIDIAPIHDVDCAGLREQHVERVNVVQLAIRNVDEARDITAQVQQRVHLDRRPLLSPGAGFGHAEMRPRKDRQTKVDGRRVERIDRVGEVETQSSLTYSRLAWTISRWANSA